MSLYVVFDEESEYFIISRTARHEKSVRAANEQQNDFLQKRVQHSLRIPKKSEFDGHEKRVQHPSRFLSTTMNFRQTCLFRWEVM